MPALPWECLAASWFKRSESEHVGYERNTLAVEGLGNFDIGLGETLYLSRTEHQASHRVWPTILRGGRFEPFQWSEITALSKGEAPP